MTFVYDTDQSSGIDPGREASGAMLAAGPQPGWVTLDAARARGFTGEIVFDTEPALRVYLDNGVVYFAEWANAGPLGRRLLEAGLVDEAQLELGTVRIGDVEHLGRLFERDPSVDRDTVLVYAETTTDELVMHVANDVIAGARATAYRHHAAGVHRWFVVPVTAYQPMRPVGEIAPIDPAAHRAPLRVADEEPEPELRIEWDEPIVGAGPAEPEPEAITIEQLEDIVFDHVPEIDDETDVFAPVLDHQPGVVPALGQGFDDGVEAGDEEVAEERAELDPGGLFPEEVDDGDEAAGDEAAAAEPDDDVDGYDLDLVVGPDETGGPSEDDGSPQGDLASFRFEIRWPDGNVDTSLQTDDDLGSIAVSATDELDAPAVSTGELRFEMPPLRLTDHPEESADVPDDVVAAVRRAIEAIEAASASPTLSPVVEEERLGEEVELRAAPFERTDRDASLDAMAPSPFAPPSPDTRAEALYAVDGGVEDRVEDAVDDPHHGGGDDRASALRRLIGGLRRKDR